MIKKIPKSPSSGCLWLLAVGFLVFIIFGVLTFILPLPGHWNLTISLIASYTLTNATVGVPSRKGRFVNMLILALLFFTGRAIILFLAGILMPTKDVYPTFTKTDYVISATLIENNKKVPIYQAPRQWIDNYGNPYEGVLQIRQQDYNNHKHITSRFKHDNSKPFWGNLYNYLATTDAPKLDLIITMFSEIHASKKLNQMEFAEMVVSCIQDIPYAFVFQDACKAPELYEESIQEILLECPNCCIGNKKYGIQNPLSFLRNLKGDCDTRTVLIFTILKQFDYDVAILNSNEYRHSILGLNLPGKGNYKIYNGKKYLVWETTSKYFEVGDISPAHDNMKFWDVVLTSK